MQPGISQSSLRHERRCALVALHSEAALAPPKARPRYGAELLLVRVVGPWCEILADDRAALNYLEAVAAQLRVGGMSVTIHTRYGDPAAALCSTAQELGAHIIVMATRARAGFARLALGSVYAAILRQVPVPLLVVRSTDVVRELEYASPVLMGSDQSGRVAA